MQFTARNLNVVLAGLFLVGISTGCAAETELINAEDSGVPTEELVGETMTVKSEVQETLVPGVITIGAQGTIVLAEQFPEDLTVGDDVEITGTVESRDVFTMDDYEDLLEVTDQETASYLLSRDEELILAEAVVTRTD